jgi:hypothetical protein
MAKAQPRIIKGAATIFENQLAKVQTVKRRPRHKTGARLSKSGAQRNPSQLFFFYSLLCFRLFDFIFPV